MSNSVKIKKQCLLKNNKSTFWLRLLLYKTCQWRSLNHIQDFTEEFKYLSDCHGTCSDLVFKYVTRFRDGHFPKKITFIPQSEF